MLNKNLIYQTSNEQLHAADLLDTTKIMEKIYSSTVFQEFMKQWGEASYRVEHKLPVDADKK